MESDKKRNAWIEAAKILCANPLSSVRCPECEHAFLQVTDERIDDTHIDRRLQCPECNRDEFIFMQG